MLNQYKIGDIINIDNDNYEIREIIASGGSGLCYRVLHNNHIYILKDYSNVKDAEGRIKHERDIISLVNDALQSNTNNPYIFWSEVISSDNPQKYFMRIDTEDGQVLSKANGLEEALSLIEKVIVSVYETCHKHGILHLDIKPDNLYSTKGRVRLLDFGCSYGQEELVEMSKESTDFSDFPVCTGTIGFRSPLLNNLYVSFAEGDQEEIEKYLKKLSVKDDIYSIVHTFFFLLTGKTVSRLWDEDDYGNYNKLGLIKKALIDEGIIDPVYQELVLEIFNKVENGKYERLISEDGKSLMDDVDLLYNIVKRKGFHDEIIIKKSIELFNVNYNARYFKIYEGILPLVDFEKKKITVTDLVFKHINSGIKNLKKNIFLSGPIGGMGKTISLWHLWRESLSLKLDEESDKYIVDSDYYQDQYVPIYVPLGLIGEEDNNLVEYIIKNYLERVGEDTEKKDYYGLFEGLLNNTKRKYIFILDGLNEINSKKTKDNLKKNVDGISEKQNCYVVISSRNYEKKYNKFSEYTINTLSEQQILDYCLVENNIEEKYEISNKLKVLSTPMLLTMFVELYSSLSYEDIKKIDFESEGDLLEAYFDSQIIHCEDAEIIIDYVLPLFTVEQLEAGKITTILDFESCSNYLHKTFDYICNNEALLSKIMNADENDTFKEIIKNEDFNRFLDWFVQITINNQHIIINNNGRYTYYHENYRDFFVAKGLAILSWVDEKRFNDNIEVAINGEMKYETGNYPARIKSMGRYRYLFDQKKNLNESSINNSCLILFKNLAYTCEEIQDYLQECFVIIHYVFSLISKLNYIKEFEFYQERIQNNQISETEIEEIADKMDMISGLIYTLQQLPGKKQITEETVNKQGYSNKEEVFSFCFESMTNVIKILELLPSTLKVLKNKAKSYGNLGAYYLAIRGREGVNTKEAIENAITYHQKALDIRLELVKTLENEDRELQEGLAMSYTCFATDYYHMNNVVEEDEWKEWLEESIEFNRKALEIRERIDVNRTGENMLSIAGNTFDLIAKSNGEVDEVYVVFCDCLTLLEKTLANIKENERKREIEKLVNIINERMTTAFDAISLGEQERDELMERCAKLSDEVVDLFKLLKPFSKPPYYARELFR